MIGDNDYQSFEPNDWMVKKKNDWMVRKQPAHIGICTWLHTPSLDIADYNKCMLGLIGIGDGDGDGDGELVMVMPMMTVMMMMMIMMGTNLLNPELYHQDLPFQLGLYLFPLTFESKCDQS